MLIVIFTIINNNNFRARKISNKKFRNIFIISVIIIGIIVGIGGSYYNKKDASKGDDIPQVISSESPLGFPSASMNRLELYSNGEVYLIKYNGEGYENNNIIERVIVAKNVSSMNVIKDENSENFGVVVLSGRNIEKINQKYPWVIYNEK